MRLAMQVLGVAAMLGGLAFIAAQVSELDWSLLRAALSPLAWLTTVIAAQAYGLLLCLLARAWLEVAQPGGPASIQTAGVIYGPAVIAKYLPGSVLQYVSRQVLGARHGLRHKDMAKSSATEAGLHILCAAIVAAICHLPQAGLLLCVIAAAAATLSRFGSSSVLRAAGYQLVFFAPFAAILWLLASVQTGIEEPQKLVGLFMLAWIAGFCVPVAPGGLGVREAVLLAMALPVASEPDVIVFALLARLVTLGGDCIFGIVTYWVAARSARSKAQASR